jgi:anthranilate synthase/aminodeoxychorismate synthase-like glutamine amidotransferase
MKILIIDNFDSFVYNLVQYVGELKADPYVKRNNDITISEINKIKPDGIIISPGPGNPENPSDIGKCLEIIKTFQKQIPILGVCLGHQAIVYAFNGKIIPAKYIMHGKTSEIQHENNSIFKDIMNPLTVMRYHSLVADPINFPSSILKITARTLKDDEIFAVQHKKYPIYGVQFHPESVGTYEGKKIIHNFLEICND